ncbi:MAG TPA: tetratricopeptide repeat protein, partial [Acidimicrobiia bacterium]|nr:tetratricopeptide repeat protein [Acidimicrobiia bacterium]
TARAAAVLRSIEEGPAALPPRAPVPRKRKLLTGGGVLAFVLVASLALAAAVGNRRDGDTVTGNAQSGDQPADPRRAALERQVRENPDDTTAHLVYANYLAEVGEIPAAVKEYVAAAQIDPKNAEAQTGAGWLTFLAASQITDPKTAAEVMDRSLARLDAAVAAAPDKADAYFYRGMVRFRGKQDPKAAIPDLERYLALVPDGALNEQVKQVLEQARQQAGG